MLCSPESPSPERGQTIQQKHSPVPHSGQKKKKKKFLDLAERGKSNDIAHCPSSSGTQYYTTREAQSWQEYAVVSGQLDMVATPIKRLSSKPHRSLVTIG